jgi:hypothetical protein
MDQEILYALHTSSLSPPHVLHVNSNVISSLRHPSPAVTSGCSKYLCLCAQRCRILSDPLRYRMQQHTAGCGCVSEGGPLRWPALILSKQQIRWHIACCVRPGWLVRAEWRQCPPVLSCVPLTSYPVHWKNTADPISLKKGFLKRALLGCYMSWQADLETVRRELMQIHLYVWRGIDLVCYGRSHPLMWEGHSSICFLLCCYVLSIWRRQDEDRWMWKGWGLIFIETLECFSVIVKHWFRLCFVEIKVVFHDSRWNMTE